MLLRLFVSGTLLSSTKEPRGSNPPYILQLCRGVDCTDAPSR